MQQVLEAIYENGIFRPLSHPKLTEGQTVQLIVQTQSSIAPEDMLALAASVYQGFSEDEITEVEQLVCDRVRNAHSLWTS
jgi:predicted DNA-binding antitoxin AbrB/MazE fold protein